MPSVFHGLNSGKTLSRIECKVCVSDTHYIELNVNQSTLRKAHVLMALEFDFMYEQLVKSIINPDNIHIIRIQNF